jgi:hypothetical protein
MKIEEYKTWYRNGQQRRGTFRELTESWNRIYNYNVRIRILPSTSKKFIKTLISVV